MSNKGIEATKGLRKETMKVPETDPFLTKCISETAGKSKVILKSAT